ncbi:MAG: hypothetical protein IE917_03540 [Betaproteobacteria bacterium]|nr:hypothetical protein [Betaproteobacteria bacterium]
MDLMDFDQAALYFDDPISPEVERLIAQAGAGYGSDETENLLLRAYFLAPTQLVVLVALYRYYFYQHRLDDALIVADRTLEAAGARLNFPQAWQQLHPQHLGYAAMRSIGLLRFYLMVLKAAGYINLRLGRAAQGEAMLKKLIEMDSHDRLGGKSLLDVYQNALLEEAAA